MAVIILTPYLSSHHPCRVRPLLGHEKQQGDLCSLLHTESPNDDKIGINVKDSTHNYAFDAVMGAKTSQTDVFEKGNVNEMIGATLQGYVYLRIHLSYLRMGYTASIL